MYIHVHVHVKLVKLMSYMYMYIKLSPNKHDDCQKAKNSYQHFQLCSIYVHMYMHKYTCIQYQEVR